MQLMDDLDQTEWNPLAKKICDLLVAQQRRIAHTTYDVNSSSDTNDGVQTFRLERRGAIELLTEWIGPEESKEFESLPTRLLDQHPAILAMDYQRRGWAKEEVQSHAAFLGAVIKRVRFGHLELNGTRVRNDQRTILQVFLEANDKPDANKSLTTLLEEFGFEMDILSFHLQHLKEKGLMRFDASQQEIVTQAGIRELKTMENEAPESLEQKRFRVLKTLYDMAPHDKHGMVNIFGLAKALGMSVQEANRILLYWEQKGMISSPSDEAVALTASAIDELEAKINHPNKPTEHFPYSITYIDNSVNIEGGVAGNVVGGQGNTYNAITNESLSAILPTLAEFISDVKKANFQDRDEVIRDFEKVYELAQRPVDQGIWELIQAKFISGETAMKVAGFVYKSHPYWPAISDFFHQLWK